MKKEKWGSVIPRHTLVDHPGVETDEAESIVISGEGHLGVQGETASIRERRADLIAAAPAMLFLLHQLVESLDSGRLSGPDARLIDETAREFRDLLAVNQ